MGDSRLKKGGINVVSGVMQNIIVMVLSLISRMIFVRILDVSYLGINGLFNNILNILSLADLGMTTAMMYNLYKPLAENDIEKIKSLVNFFRKVYTLIAVAVLVVGLVLVPFLPYVINLENTMEHIAWYYILALLNVVVSYLYVYRTILLTADQKNYILNNIAILFKVITFFVQTGVLILFKNYFLYLLVALVFSVVCNYVQSRVALKNYSYLKLPAEKISLDDKKNILSNVKDLFLYRLSGIIQTNTDNLLISVMIGTIYVGYYSNYQLIMTAVVSIVNTIFTAIKSSVGNFMVTSNTEDKINIYWVLELLNYWLIAFCSVCFVCLYEDAVHLFFGEEYVLEMAIVIAMVLNFYTSNIRQTIWAYRESTGVFHETRYITAVTAILNIFLSIILGNYFGILGILIATVISRMLYAWWKEPKVLFEKVFHTSSNKYIYKYIMRFFLGVIICAITFFICNIVSIDNIILRIVYKCIICVIITNLCLFFVYKNNKEWDYIQSRIIKLLK